MNMLSAYSMLDHVTESIPETFFQYLANHQEGIYKEAESALSNPLWTVIEGRPLQGHVRRAIAENAYRKAADASKLAWEDVKYVGGWMSSVHVFAKNLRVTLHKVASPWSFVTPCRSRQQDAVANRFLDGYVLNDVLLAPLPSIRNANAIQMYILHGRSFIRGEFTNFLNVAIPDSNLNGYCWQKTFDELRQAYSLSSRFDRPVDSPVTGAVASLKSSKKEKQG